MNGPTAPTVNTAAWANLAGRCSATLIAAARDGDQTAVISSISTCALLTAPTPSMPADTIDGRNS